jgi:hypothetical protein
MERDERTSSIEPAGVMAMAGTPRRPDATREAPAEIAAGINWQLARDRPGLLILNSLRSKHKAAYVRSKKNPHPCIKRREGGVSEGRRKLERHFVAGVQVLDTCFTSVIVSVDCDPPAAAPDAGVLLDPAAELDAEVVPLIFTSWPTCSVNFEVSPAS